MPRLRLLLGVNLFWLALSMVGEGLTTLLLPALLLGAVDQRIQASVLGLLTFVGLLLGVLVQPIAGLISDQQRARVGRQPLVVWGAAGMLLGVAFLSAPSSLLIVFGAYTLIQVAASLSQAAYQGWLPDLVPRALRGTAAGLKGLMDLGGALLAFTVLGALLGRGQAPLALWAIAGVIVLALTAVWLLVRETKGLVPDTVAPQTRPPRLTLAAAFRLDLSQHRDYAWLVASRFLFLLGTYAVGRFLLLFVAQRLSLNAAQAAQQAGGLLAVLTLLTAMAAPLSGWAADRVGRVPLMLLGAGLSTVGTLLLSVAGSAVSLLLFGGLMALGSAAFSSANWALTADLAPPAEAGRFLGLANVGTAGAVAAAGLFGPLVDGLNHAAPGAGYSALFVSASVLAALSGLAATRIRQVSADSRQMVPTDRHGLPGQPPEPVGGVVERKH